ncbi:uncharacterized protein LOC144916440 [Branchiostoma floridae x Branchiostoma belcheri]
MEDHEEHANGNAGGLTVPGHKRQLSPHEDVDGLNVPRLPPRAPRRPPSHEYEVPAEPTVSHARVPTLEVPERTLELSRQENVDDVNAQRITGRPPGHESDAGRLEVPGHKRQLARHECEDVDGLNAPRLPPRASRRPRTDEYEVPAEPTVLRAHVPTLEVPGHTRELSRHENMGDVNAQRVTGRPPKHESEAGRLKVPGHKRQLSRHEYEDVDGLNAPRLPPRASRHPPTHKYEVPAEPSVLPRPAHVPTLEVPGHTWELSRHGLKDDVNAPEHESDAGGLKVPGHKRQLSRHEYEDVDGVNAPRLPPRASRRPPRHEYDVPAEPTDLSRPAYVPTLEVPEHTGELSRHENVDDVNAQRVTGRPPRHESEAGRLEVPGHKRQLSRHECEDVDSLNAPRLPPRASRRPRTDEYEVPAEPNVLPRPAHVPTLEVPGHTGDSRHGLKDDVNAPEHESDAGSLKVPGHKRQLSRHEDVDGVNAPRLPPRASRRPPRHEYDVPAEPTVDDVNAQRVTGRPSEHESEAGRLKVPGHKRQLSRHEYEDVDGLNVPRLPPRASRRPPRHEYDVPAEPTFLPRPAHVPTLEVPEHTGELSRHENVDDVNAQRVTGRPPGHESEAGRLKVPGHKRQLSRHEYEDVDGVNARRRPPRHEYEDVPAEPPGLPPRVPEGYLRHLLHTADVVWAGFAGDQLVDTSYTAEDAKQREEQEKRRSTGYRSRERARKLLVWWNSNESHWFVLGCGLLVLASVVAAAILTTHLVAGSKAVHDSNNQPGATHPMPHPPWLTTFFSPHGENNSFDFVNLTLNSTPLGSNQNIPTTVTVTTLPTTAINGCESEPCHHRTCVDNNGGYNCSCSPGWTGQNCQQDTNECAQNPCQHGTCVNQDGGYNCTCSPGWTGQNCQQDTNECTSKPCHHGRCVNKDGGYSCTCSPGWTGQNCQQDLNKCGQNPCQHGTCVNKDGGYKCTCSPGWTGQNCQKDIDECATKPCQHGTCANKDGGYKCTCSPGWTGQNCQNDINECAQHLCQHGTCVNKDGGYKCTCSPGWTGQNCQQDINECTTKPCLHGTCVNKDGGYKCTCSPGWTGQRCQQDINECATKQCEHGTCVNKDGGYKCTCSPGWTGQNCQKDVNECTSKPCQHGRCVNKDGGYTCTCSHGWTGQKCQNDINECTSKPCHHGRCVNKDGGYTCTCSHGWTGQNCQNDINECTSKPCGHGQCVNKDGGYTCTCSPGWTGKNCQQMNKDVLRKCRDGWTQRNNHCYKLSTESADWNTAHQWCKSEGANLASIQNLAENNVIKDIISKASAGLPVVWLGLRDLNKGGQWKWTDGSRVSYTNWAPNEPESTRTRRSIILNPTTILNGWILRPFRRQVNGGTRRGRGDPGNCVAVYYKNARHPAYPERERKRGQWKDDFCIRNYLYLCKSKLL